MTQGKYVEDDYKRDNRYINTRITASGEPDGFKVEPGLHRLVVSWACPWANRAIITRALLGPEEVISMGFAGRPMKRKAGPSIWTLTAWTRCWGSRGSRMPMRRGRTVCKPGVTVPAIVDVTTGQVVTNDFRQITEDFAIEWRQFHESGAPDLYPERLREEIDEVELVYPDVYKGVAELRRARWCSSCRGLSPPQQTDSDRGQRVSTNSDRSPGT